MLRFLSQRSGIRKAVLWGIIAVLVLGLGIVFALPSGRSMLRNSLPIGSSTIVASVDGYPITLSELQNQLKVYGMNQQFQSGRTDPSQIDATSLYPQFGKQAVDTLINARIVRHEADRLGFGATRKEMQDRITSMFVGQDGKWIGEQAYLTRLRQQGLTVEGFERDIADGITEEKLRNFVTSGIEVSDKEIEEDYRRTNTTMRPTYVLVAPKLDQVPEPTDADLRSYYDAHRNDFKINQTQRKVTYLFVDQEALGKTLAVPDEELKKDYDENKFVSAIHVAKIVFKIPDPKQDAEVRKKAEDVAARARGNGADKPGEDFAELAKQNSQDAETAAKGGDAGYIEKASLKPGDPRERLFSLNKDQTSSAIKVDDSYVVYKVLDKKSKTFEEARDELLEQARKRNAYSKGVEVAQQAEQKLRDSKDPNKVAEELNASLGTQAVSVRETPYLQPGDQIPGLGSNAQFDSELSDLQNVGDVGSTVGVTGGFAVPMLADKRDPHDATFEEVRDRVVSAWRQDTARQKARDIAQQLASESTSPDDLKARAKALGLEAKTQENFKAGGALPDLQASDLIDSALLEIPQNSVAKTPVELPSGFAVLAVNDRKDPDMGDAFTNQKDSIRQRLESTKQGQLYAEYLKNVRKNLEEQGKITIYQETLDRAFAYDTGEDEDEDTGVPTMPPAGAPKPTLPRPTPAPVPAPVPATPKK